MENNTNNIDEGHLTIQALFCTAHSSGNYKLLLSIINSIFSITAFLGNILILVALHKESSLHPPSKLLYRCLAITDLFVGLISEPSAAVYSMTLGIVDRQYKHWLNLCFYSAAICTVTFTILCTVSLLTLVAISVDRLLALLAGLRYKQVVTMRRTKALVICFWISSIGFASLSIWKYEIPFTFRYGIILLCIVISTFCYSKIYFDLRHRLHHYAQHEPQAREIPLNIARYRKTVSTALWVQLTLVICYLPYSIVIAVITIKGSSPFLDAVWGFSAAFVYLNSSLNPFLYCWKIRGLRQAVKATVRQFFYLELN